MLLVTIDPSMNDVGWAVFFDGDFREAGTFSTKGKTELDHYKHLLVHCTTLFARIKSAYDGRLITVVLERPGTWGAKESVGAAAGGSLQKLHFAIGIIMGRAWDDGCMVDFVTVGEWKGNLPKSVIQERVEKLYGVKCNSTHMAEAIGIGHYYITRRVLLAAAGKGA